VHACLHVVAPSYHRGRLVVVAIDKLSVRLVLAQAATGSRFALAFVL